MNAFTPQPYNKLINYYFAIHPDKLVESQLANFVSQRLNIIREPPKTAETAGINDEFINSSWD